MSADALLELAVNAAHTAGELLLGRFGGPQSGVDAKSSATDMVSDADRDAERLLLDAITSARPDDGLIAEESGHRPGTTGLVWVVDPLDGTTNYLYGIPAWSVSVACRDAEGGLVAVVHDPSDRWSGRRPLRWQERLSEWRLPSPLPALRRHARSAGAVLSHGRRRVL